MGEMHIKILTSFDLRLEKLVHALEQTEKRIFFKLHQKLPMRPKIGFGVLRRINKRALLALLISICVWFSLSIIASSQWASIIIGSRGNLKIDGVGVYKDRSCIVAITYLDWGTLEPGSVRNATLYIRNEGNHGVTLFLATDNWNPVNTSSYMVLSWNYDGRMLGSLESVEVTLTLSVSLEVQNIADFSFDVIIGVN